VTSLSPSRSFHTRLIKALNSATFTTMMITRSYTPRHNENNQDTPPKSTPPAARAPYHSRSWLIWLISASTSLLSARYLLIETNFHYPLLLYVTHLLFMSAVVLKQCSWRRQAQESEYQNSRRSRTVLGTLIVSATVCLTAVSTSFMFQAILHFRNFPTLLMLTVSLPPPLHLRSIDLF
jgi:hypothetical protein